MAQRLYVVIVIVMCYQCAKVGVTSAYRSAGGTRDINEQSLV